MEVTYAVRPHGTKWQIVHIPTGTKMEVDMRYRSYACALCRKYNEFRQ